MKVYIFAKRDEIILSTVASLVVGGLIYLGVISLWHDTIHTMFIQNQHHSISVKQLS